MPNLRNNYGETVNLAIRDLENVTYFQRPAGADLEIADQWKPGNERTGLLAQA
jgi:hypothetical protein